MGRRVTKKSEPKTKWRMSQIERDIFHLLIRCGECSANAINTLPYSRNRIGIVTRRMIEMEWIDEVQVTHRVWRKYKSTGWIRVKASERGFRLNPQAISEELVQAYISPSEFEQGYKRTAEIIHRGERRANRALRQSEVEAIALRLEKEGLKNFISSSVIKKKQEDDKAEYLTVQSSKAYGVFYNNEKAYPTYNILSNQFESFDIKSETRFRVRSKQITDKKIDSRILLCKSLKNFKKLLTGNMYGKEISEDGEKVNIVKNTIKTTDYRHTLLVSMTQTGIRLLSILLADGGEDFLRQLAPMNQNGRYTMCDAELKEMNDTVRVFNFLIPDAGHLLEMNVEHETASDNIKYRVYCFEEYTQSILETFPYAEVIEVSLDNAYMQMML